MRDKDYAFGWMLFDQKIGNFRAICDKGLTPRKEQCGSYKLKQSYVNLDDITKSVTTFVDLGGTLTNLMLIQKPDQLKQGFARNLSYIWAQMIDRQREIQFFNTTHFYVNDTKTDKYNKIPKLDHTLDVIGLFAKVRADNTYNVYVLIRNQKSIAYCLIDDVSECHSSTLNE